MVDLYQPPAIIQPASARLIRPAAPCIIRARELPPHLAMPLPGMPVMPVAAPAPRVLTLTNTDNGVTNGGTYSFGDAPGGGETRYIVVVARAFNGVITAVSIGGSAGTEVVTSNFDNASVGIYIREVAAGTTGAITVTGGSVHAISVFRLMNPSSATAAATATDNTPSSGLIDLSLNVPVGGGAVGGTQGINAGTSTWVGLTEVHDVDINSNEWSSAAFGTTAGSPLTVTATSSDTTPTEYVGAAASWV